MYSFLGIRSSVQVGFGTLWGYGLAVLAAAIAVIGEIGDDLAPLGVTPSHLLWTTAVLVIAVTLGRFAQRVWGSAPVDWGIGSAIAFGVSVISALLLVLGDLVDEAFLLGVSPNVWEKIIAALTVALTFGRQLQAAFGFQEPDVILDDVVPDPVVPEPVTPAPVTNGT